MKQRYLHQVGPRVPPCPSLPFYESEHFFPPFFGYEFDGRSPNPGMPSISLFLRFFTLLFFLLHVCRHNEVALGCVSIYCKQHVVYSSYFFLDAACCCCAKRCTLMLYLCCTCTACRLSLYHRRCLILLYICVRAVQLLLLL